MPPVRSARPSESTDARIVETAAAHVRRFGRDRMTIVGVATELGMSHANIYRYFPSKEALLEALTMHWLRPIEAGLHEIADAPDPAHDKLERMLAGLFRGYRDKLETDPELFAIFAIAVRHGSGAGRKHRNRLQSELQRVIEEGIATSAFAGADVRRCLALVFDVMYRFIHPGAVELDADIPRNQIDLRFRRAGDALLRALR